MTSVQEKTAQPFLSINAASAATGLSAYYLRCGCVSNQVPHIRSGNKYLINIPRLLEQLDAESGGKNE